MSIPALAPMAWTIFAQTPLPTKAEWLAIVNRMVNRAIDPDPSPPQVGDPWRVWPMSGQCHDYAVTKREELLLRGYHAGELLLCECQLPDGRYHLVLLVGGMVLDNLRDEIVPWAECGYRAVVTQSAADPNFWQS